MHGHLVAVKVGIKCGTDHGVHLDGIAFNEHGTESLNTEAVQGRRAVEEHVLFANDIFKDCPYLRDFLFNKLARAADVVGKFGFKELPYHKGAEELQRHVLGESTLVKLEFWADDDYAAAGVVNALA